MPSDPISVSRRFVGGVLIALAPLSAAPAQANPDHPDARRRHADSVGTHRVVELTSYTLKAGKAAAYDSLVLEVLPMLQAHDIDVVGFGPSADRTDAYLLVRAYDSENERRQKETLFYGSAEWRDGPRERVLALIQHYTTVVMMLEVAAVETLRAGLARSRR